MKARIDLGAGGELLTDLSQPVDIAIGLDFSDAQPRHFGAPPAASRPFSVPGFSGSEERLLEAIALQQPQPSIKRGEEAP